MMKLMHGSSQGVRRTRRDCKIFIDQRGLPGKVVGQPREEKLKEVVPLSCAEGCSPEFPPHMGAIADAFTNANDNNAADGAAYHSLFSGTFCATFVVNTSFPPMA